MISAIKSFFYRFLALGPMFMVGLVLAFASIAMYTTSLSATSKAVQVAAAESVDLATQAVGTTYQNPLISANPNPAQIKQGLLPISVLSYTQFQNLLNNKEIKLHTAALNSDSRVTAVVATKAGVQKTYATFTLPDQTNNLLATYDKLGAQVNVAAPDMQLNAVIKKGTGNSRQTVTDTWSSSKLTAAAALPYGYAPTAVAVATKTTPGFKGYLLSFTAILLMLTALRKRKAETPQKVGEGKVGSLEDKKDLDDIPVTRFTDIAGCDEAVEEMQELVLFIKEPERFERLNIQTPKGALLVGPPGTGKTLLARAVAGEAGLPFYSVAGSDFTEIYVGKGAKRVRDLFTKARKHENGAIIFIDEVDAVAKARSSHPEGSSQEQEGTLNALLVEMDGFVKSKVIVIAATNRDDVLDPAITRPGRLDKKVMVSLPDRLGREKILMVHSLNKPIAECVDFTHIAKRTPGMSGAELAQIVNEACLQVAREDRDSVLATDFDHAIATVTMGKARTSAVVSEEDRVLTAWHESGHAIAGLVQKDSVSPVAVSIVPRGSAGGVTHFPQRDSGYMKRAQAYAQLVTALGGMAAEQELLGNGQFTTGPSSDLEVATNLSLAMVTQYGMGEHLLVTANSSIFGSAGAVADKVVNEADALLQRALLDAKDIIRENRELFDNMVNTLLEYETLSSAMIDDLMLGREVCPPKPAPTSIRNTHQLAPATSDLLQPGLEKANDPNQERKDPVSPKKRKTPKIRNTGIRFPGKKAKGTAIITFRARPLN